MAFLYVSADIIHLPAGMPARPAAGCLQAFGGENTACSCATSVAQQLRAVCRERRTAHGYACALTAAAPGPLAAQRATVLSTKTLINLYSSSSLIMWHPVKQDYFWQFSFL